MNKIVEVYKNMSKHPMWDYSAAKRFLGWQLTKNKYPEGKVVDWVNSTKLNICKGRPEATGNYYLGLVEFNEMAFWTHYLREDDSFIDIGANVGSYSVLGGQTGASGIAVEPAIDTYNFLRNNIETNNLQNIRLLNIGLASESGELNFSVGLDSVNHVLSDEEMKSGVESVCVPVETLNQVIYKTGMDVNALKMDVEGFEESVIEGGVEVMRNSSLNVILCEVFGDKDLCNLISSFGFGQYSYDPLTRTLEEIDATQNNNAIFIRDIKKAKERILTANPIKVYGWEI